MLRFNNIILLTIFSSVCFAPGTDQNPANTQTAQNSAPCCLCNEDFYDPKQPRTARTADVCVAVTAWTAFQCGRQGYHCVQSTTNCIQKAHEKFEKLAVPQPPDFKKKMQ